MVPSLQALKLLMSTIALMSLLAVAYGVVARVCRGPSQLFWSMGALFGAAAILALYDPIRIAEGVQVDLRGVPLTLAAAYLGWRGATVATAMSLALRIGIGGPGMVTGCVSISLYVLAGLAWAWLVRDAPRRSLRALAGLAGLSLVHLLATLLLPSDLAWRFVTTVWPVIVPIEVMGVMVVGSLLERERWLVDYERGLARAAERDPLTGLLNRRGFEAAAARARPEFTGAALLLLDLDRFKRINDVHGHIAGDAVLRELGPRLTLTLGDRGLIGRIGGEEIAVFLPSILPRETAAMAERLRAAVGETPFRLPDGGGLDVTTSIGVAWTPGAFDLGVQLARADLMLYAAKQAGRNRVFPDADELESGRTKVPAPSVSPRQARLAAA